MSRCMLPFIFMLMRLFTSSSNDWYCEPGHQIFVFTVFLPPAYLVCGGNVFSRVCVSVYRGGVPVMGTVETYSPVQIPPPPHLLASGRLTSDRKAFLY